jgi:hypothetical protein
MIFCNAIYLSMEQAVGFVAVYQSRGNGAGELFP